MSSDLFVITSLDYGGAESRVVSLATEFAYRGLRANCYQSLNPLPWRRSCSWPVSAPRLLT